MGNTYTKAQAKASGKYDSKFAKVTVRVTPELKESIKKYCKKHNISEVAFARQAFINQLDKDKTTPN